MSFNPSNLIKNNSSEKKRILIVCYVAHDSGGAGISTFLLAKELKKRNWDVMIASTKKYPGFKTFVFKEFRNIPFFEIRDIYLKRFLAKIIKKERIEIIHSSECRFSIVGVIKAARLYKIPVVSHYRGYAFSCLNGLLVYKKKENCSGMNLKKCLKCSQKTRWPWELYKYFYIQRKKEILKKADVHIAIGRTVKDELIKVGIKGNIEVVYDLCSFTHGLGEDVVANFKKEKKIKGIVLTFVGNLYYSKGINFFLEIVKQLNLIRDDLFFVIAGGIPDKEIGNKCLSVDKYKNVLILNDIGHQNIQLVYQISDIIIYPLLPTGFGRIVIEAAVSGKPIIASRLEGIDEAVIDGETGFLAKSGDLNDWLEKINILINDPCLREEMGKNSKDKSKKFSSDVIVKKMVLIYNNLLQ